MPDTDPAEHDPEPPPLSPASDSRKIGMGPVIVLVVGLLGLLVALVCALIAAGIGGQLDGFVGAPPTPGDTATGNAIAGTLTGLAFASAISVLFGAGGLAMTVAGAAWLVWRRRQLAASRTE